MMMTIQTRRLEEKSSGTPVEIALLWEVRSWMLVWIEKRWKGGREEGATLYVIVCEIGSSLNMNITVMLLLSLPDKFGKHDLMNLSRCFESLILPPSIFLSTETKYTPSKPLTT
jgi:hypothetical protein